MTQKKKRFGSLIKATVSLLFIYLILNKVSWQDLKEVLRNTNFLFLFLSFAISPVMVVVSVWKWYVLLKAQKTPVSFLRLLLLYHVGYLFNNVLPSNVGGDVVVSYELGKHTKRPFESVASVFMNRFTGILVLLPASVFSLLMNVSLFRDITVASTMSLVAAGSATLIWLVLDNRPMQILKKRCGNTIVAKLLGKLEKLQAALRVYRDDPGTIFYSLLISVLFFILMVVNVYLGCLAFGVIPSWSGLFVVVPFIQVVSMLPITLGGFGLKEWAYVVAFPQIGISTSLGLSVSLLLRLKGIVSGLIGGMLYPLLGKKERDEYAGATVQ